MASKEQARRYRMKHLHKVRRRERLSKRKSRARLKERVLTRYSPKGGLGCCWAECDWVDIRALSLDHLKGGGTRHRKDIGVGEMYGWIVRKGYPRGYQTLCMNHQFVKKAENNEDHRRKG